MTHWLQTFFDHPTFWNVSAVIVAYLFVGWCTASVLVLFGWGDDPPAFVAIFVWPIFVCVGSAIGFLGLAFFLGTASLAPSEAARKKLTKFKCLTCKRRVPFENVMCYWCSRKG